MDFEPKPIPVGTEFTFSVVIVRAKDLPSQLSNDVSCSFRLYKEYRDCVTKVVRGNNPHPKFGDVFKFTYIITDEFSEYLSNGVLNVQVWGHFASDPSRLPPPIRVGTFSANIKAGELKHVSNIERS